MKELSHDAFGRFSVVRKNAGNGECEFCGQKKKLYYYGTQSDSINGKTDFYSKKFCSVGCFRNYYDIRK